MLWAYEGNTLILETPVSTGLVPNSTERGRWRVRYKVPTEDMRERRTPKATWSGWRVTAAKRLPAASRTASPMSRMSCM